MNIETDSTHYVDTPVTLSMTANSFATRPGESYPAVLSTPFLVSELERVCAALLVCCLTNKAPHACETIASRARCILFKISSPLAFQT